MKLRTVLAAGLLLVGAQVARADGDAGCGLGGMLIQDNTKLMQIIAATLNGSFGSQTFGISTGTSNCRADAIVMNDKAVQYFAEVNQEDLSRQMAQGQGEKLMTLASLYGCKGEAQQAFAKMTQTSYARILPASSTSAQDMVQNLNKELRSNAPVAQSCGAI